MKILSQRDQRWASTTIGKSSTTLGRAGCTITCLSMLSDYYDCYNSPDKIAKLLTFQKDLVVWPSISQKLCFDFVGRFYKRNDKVIIEAIKDPRRAVLLQLQNYHWVVAIGKNLFGGYKIADPWTGKISTTRAYSDNITGFSIFIKK